MTTLVTGGTGTIGRLVVRGLQERGLPVRVLSRRGPDDLPDGVDHVAADLAGPVPDAAFEGVDRLFLFPADGDLSPFLKQAREAGVGHVVVLSSLAAAGEKERDRDSESALHHRRVEDAVAASGLPATVLRPGNFAANLLFWSHAIRFTGGVEGPYPDAAQTLVHEADVADVAVAALTAPDPIPAVHVVTGPEVLTQAEQLATIGAALGRPLEYRTISPEQFTATMTQWMSPGIVAMLLRYWSETVSEPDVARSAEPLTGRARTLAEWVADHVDAFR